MNPSSQSQGQPKKNEEVKLLRVTCTFLGRGGHLDDSTELAPEEEPFISRAGNTLSSILRVF